MIFGSPSYNNRFYWFIMWKLFIFFAYYDYLLNNPLNTMIKFFFYSVILIIATVSECLLSFQQMQLFPLIIVTYYITFQRGWQSSVFYAIFFGIMADSMFQHTNFIYLFSLTLIVLPTANYWRKNGDHSNPIARIIPIPIIVGAICIFKSIYLSPQGLGFYIIHASIYTILSSALCFILAFFLTTALDDITKALRLSTYIFDKKNLN